MEGLNACNDQDTRVPTMVELMAFTVDGLYGAALLLDSLTHGRLKCVPGAIYQNPDHGIIGGMHGGGL